MSSGVSNTSAEERPIFVVGASRSGTALMRSVLNNHPLVRLATETHYFDDLRLRLKGSERTPLTPEQRQICEDYFLALGHRPYGHGGEARQSRIQREDLCELADRLGSGADSYFEAFCRLDGGCSDAVRWGEKTPRHLFRLLEIFGRYPGAQVICMVRDPRGVVASYRDWRNQGGFDLEADPGHEEMLEREHERTRRSYHIVIQSLLWRGGVRAALEAQVRFGPERVRIQLYESLTQDPAAVVSEIAEWLGIDYRESMLEVPVHNSTYSRFDPRGGVSTEAVQRWREKLSDGEVRVIQSCCGTAMVDAGYEPVSVSAPWWVALGPWLSLPVAILRAMRANRGRIGDLGTYLGRRLLLVLRSHKAS